MSYKQEAISESAWADKYFGYAEALQRLIEDFCKRSISEASKKACPHHAEMLAKYAAQQSVQRTALWRGLAVSLLCNIVLLAVLLVSIGGG